MKRARASTAWLNRGFGSRAGFAIPELLRDASSPELHFPATLPRHQRERGACVDCRPAWSRGRTSEPVSPRGAGSLKCGACGPRPPLLPSRSGLRSTSARVSAMIRQELSTSYQEVHGSWGWGRKQSFPWGIRAGSPRSGGWGAGGVPVARVRFRGVRRGRGSPRAEARRGGKEAGRRASSGCRRRGMEPGPRRSRGGPGGAATGRLQVND